MRQQCVKLVKLFKQPLPGSLLIGICAGMLMFAVRSLFSAEVGADALYHSTHARIIATTGDWNIVRPWIVQHFFSTFPANPYVLAHTFLAILLIIFDNAAANVWVAFQVGSVVGIFFYIVKCNKISHPLYWTLIAFLSSSALLFRLSLARPFALGMGLFLLGIHFMATKHWRALFVLSTVYLLYYNFAIMLGAFAVLYVLVGFKKKDWSLSPITSVFGGFLAALIIHPHTLGYVNLIYIHAVKIPWLRFTGVPLMSGQEIMSQVPNQLIASFLLPLIALIVATIIFTKKKQASIMMQTLLIWCVSWLAITFFMPRAIEYWILPAWLLVALVIREAEFSWPRKYSEYKKVAQYGLTSLLVLVLCANVLQALVLITESGTNTEEQDLMNIALFLTEVSPKESNVYYPNWAIFPKLFAHNDHNHYLVGFDPVFQYEYSKEMYWLWHNISTQATLCSHAPPCGYVPTDQEVTLLFTRSFRTPYLVLPTEYADAIRERIETLPTARLLFQTPTHVLYEIEEQVDP